MSGEAKPVHHPLSGGRVIYEGCLLFTGEGLCTASDPCAPCATLWINRVILPALASLSLIKDEVPGFFSAYVKAHKAYVAERLIAMQGEDAELKHAIEVVQDALANPSEGEKRTGIRHQASAREEPRKAADWDAMANPDPTSRSAEEIAEEAKAAGPRKLIAKRRGSLSKTSPTHPPTVTVSHGGRKNGAPAGEVPAPSPSHPEPQPETKE